MADKISADRRSRNMAAIRSKNTKPEMIVRQMVHSMGHRYRLHRKDLPGKPDLVFGPRRKVIFVHGCFWHQHPDPGCKDSRLPKTRLDYWLPKLERNVERDHSCQKMLEEMGWCVLTVWECVVRDKPALECRLTEFLAS